MRMIRLARRLASLVLLGIVAGMPRSALAQHAAAMPLSSYYFLSIDGDAQASQGLTIQLVSDNEIQITYDTTRAVDGWFQLDWLYPAFNYCNGTTPSLGPGHNLRGSSRIEFWAWGDTGQEQIHYATHRSCNSLANEYDSTQQLSTQPQLFTIDFQPGDDLSSIVAPLVIGSDKNYVPSLSRIAIHIRDITFDGLDEPVSCQTPSPLDPPLPLQTFSANLQALDAALMSTSGWWTSSQCNINALQDAYDRGARYLVTYGSGRMDAAMVHIARSIGFEKAVLGICDPERIPQQVQDAVNLAPYVDGFSVGNEYLSRGCESPYDTSLSTDAVRTEQQRRMTSLMAIMQDVRQRTHKPVTTTEIATLDPSLLTQVIAASDWVFVNAHPYYSCNWTTIEAVNWTLQQYELVANQAAHKVVSLKELGLPPADVDHLLDKGNCPMSDPSVLTVASPIAYYEALQARHCQAAINFVYFFFRPSPTPYTPSACPP